jgi:hypothetical protein
MKQSNLMPARAHRPSFVCRNPRDHRADPMPPFDFSLELGHKNF